MSARAVAIAFDALNELQARSPDAVRLARVASVAVRIEPHLLRRLRLGLVPGADVGAEGDLWFSALVESNSSGAIVLRPDASRALREHLAQDRQTLVNAVAVVREAHRAAPSTLRLEEEINGLALVADADVVERIDDAIRPALAALVRGDANRALDIARWMFRAAPSLVPSVWRSGNAHALLHASSALLRERRFVRPAASGPPLHTLAWAVPPSVQTRKIAVGVELLERAVRFSRPADVPAIVQVPDTSPPLVEISYTFDGADRTHLAEAVPGTVVALAGEVDRLVLRTSGGDEYLLETEREQPPGFDAQRAVDQSVQTLALTSATPVHAVAALDDGRVAATGANGAITVWNPVTGSVTELRGHAKVVLSLAAVAGGRLLSGSADCTVKLWDADSSSPLRSLEGHHHSVLAVAHDGSGHVVSGAFDGQVIVWDRDQPAARLFLEGHREPVPAIAISADLRLVVSGSHDRTLRVWDVDRGGATIRLMEGHRDEIHAVTLLRDGRQALSGSADRTVRLWDIPGGKVLRAFEGHSHTVTAVVALPDGSRFLSGSADGTLKLWHVDHNEPLRTLEGHAAQVTSISLLSGSRAVSGSSDGILKIWDLQERAAPWRPRTAKVLEPSWMDDACVPIETLGSQGAPATAFYVSPSRLVTAASRFRGIPFLSIPSGQVKVLNDRVRSTPVLLLEPVDGHVTSEPLTLGTDFTKRPSMNVMTVPSTARVVGVVNGDPVAIEADVRGSLNHARVTTFEAFVEERELPAAFLGAPVIIGDAVAGIVTEIEASGIGNTTRLVAAGSSVILSAITELAQGRREPPPRPSEHPGDVIPPTPSTPSTSEERKQRWRVTSDEKVVLVEEGAGIEEEKPPEREGWLKRLNRIGSNLLWGSPATASPQPEAPEGIRASSGAAERRARSRQAPQVFLSHVRVDEALATEVRDAVEQEGLKCWSFPRDVRRGDNFVGAIEAAVEESDLLIVLLSETALGSELLRHGIELAIRRQMPILPLRIGDVHDSDDLARFLGGVQMFDVGGRSLGAQRPALVAAVRSLLPGNIQDH